MICIHNKDDENYDLYKNDEDQKSIKSNNIKEQNERRLKMTENYCEHNKLKKN